MSNQLNAVLVRLTISVFSNSRQDAEITNDVVKRHKLNGKAGKWTKYKLPEEALKPIKEFAGICRRRHYDITLPWEDSYRLLTLAAHQTYEAQFKTFQDQFDDLVVTFVEKYGDWLEQAKVMHGSKFNPSDYPSAENIASRFKFGVEYSPIPKSNHFLTKLNAKALEIMKADLEARNEERIQEAVTDTWNRLIAPVQAMADKLSSEDAIFRDTLVDNIKDIVELVPALNLTGSNELETAANEIKEKLGSLDPNKLREDKVVRKEAAEAAKNLLARFGAVGKRKLAA